MLHEFVMRNASYYCVTIRMHDIKYATKEICDDDDT